MWRNGLRDNTLEVFDKVSKLECIKDLYLCGGTGITPTLYPKPQDFDLMQPKYNVSAEEMADYFMDVLSSRKK